MQGASKLTRRLLGATLLGGMMVGLMASGEAMAQDRSLKVWFGRQDFIPED